jgi:Phosphotransferase enzyme family
MYGHNFMSLGFVEYRVVLIDPNSIKLLAIATPSGCHLPRVRISKDTRPVEQLRHALRSTWGAHVLILDFVFEKDGWTPCVIVELLKPSTTRRLESVALNQLSHSELTDAERSALLSLLTRETSCPFARIGWLAEASAWIEAVTGHTVSHTSDVEQLNAGGAFALVHLHSDDGWNCWLKATGEPNRHELAISALLSRLCKGYVPEILDSKPEWNAWLMAGEAKGITSLPENPFELFRLLEDAVGSMAELQARTVGATSELLCAGAFDQRLVVLTSNSEALFDYLDEVMDLSTSSNLPHLEKECLREIRIAFQIVCERLEHLSIPETIVHGDMNLGNIVIGREHCQFIDWSEAYVGHCLVTLEHLLMLLNNVGNPRLRAFMKASLQQRYASVWTTTCNPDDLKEGLLYMPLMAAISALHGRGSWFNSPERYGSRCISYARTLVVYMDRALRRRDLQEALGALRPTQLGMPMAATGSQHPSSGSSRPI